MLPFLLKLFSHPDEEVFIFLDHFFDVIEADIENDTPVILDVLIVKEEIENELWGGNTVDGDHQLIEFFTSEHLVIEVNHELFVFLIVIRNRDRVDVGELLEALDFGIVERDERDVNGALEEGGGYF